LEDILRFSRGFSDSDIVHSYAKRLRRKRAILLAQIALSFYNKGPSIRAKNNDPLAVFVFVSLFERLSWLLWGARAKPLRWGRQPRSWAKYHGKRGQNQGFSSSICVDEALRFPPQFGRSPTVRCFLYACYGNPMEGYVDKR
jgi:hypothetical protein